MSVPVYRRTKGKLEVLVKARQFFEEFAKAVTNENKFPPIYQDVIIKDLVTLAKNVYLKCWRANNIRVVDSETYLSRRRLQEEALLDIKDFIGLLSPTVKLCHLRTKRAIYWVNQMSEIATLITAWKQSDKKRYDKMEEDAS